MEEHAIHDETSAVRRILQLTGAVNGDDAAVLRAGGSAICVSTDSTIAGVHAPATTSAHDLGRRAAARALSDLAAMGAAPLGVTCAVHVPAGDRAWADAVLLVEGIAARVSEQGTQLVGGDLCRTPSPALGVTVTVLGRRAGAPRGSTFSSRAGARASDELFVTGLLGAPGAALARGDATLPEPPDRIRAGIALARFATARIDLSDGLASDAGHLARASRVDAVIDLALLPLAHDAGDPVHAATAGDDYELLVALAPGAEADTRAALAAVDSKLPLTRIGSLADGSGIARFWSADTPVDITSGFVHR